MEKGAAENQILLLNMEDFENAELLDAKKLYNFIKSKSEAADEKKRRKTLRSGRIPNRLGRDKRKGTPPAKIASGTRRQLSKTYSYNGRPSALKRKRNYKEEYKGVDFGGVKGGASIQIQSAI